MKARGLLCLAAHATGQVEPEVNIRPRSIRHKDSLRGRVSELSGALSVSSTLHLSAIVWWRANETRLYSGIWTCRSYVDGLKIRQHPNCQRGTADVLAFTVSEVFEHLRVYLCPSTVAGIHTKLVLVGNGSRELALTLLKLHRVPCVIVASSFLALSQRFQQSP